MCFKENHFVINVSTEVKKINTCARLSCIMGSGCGTVDQWIEWELVLFHAHSRILILQGIYISPNYVPQHPFLLHYVSIICSSLFLFHLQPVDESNGSSELGVPVFHLWKYNLSVKGKLWLQVQCRVDFHLSSYSHRERCLNKHNQRK